MHATVLATSEGERTGHRLEQTRSTHRKVVRVSRVRHGDRRVPAGTHAFDLIAFPPLRKLRSYVRDATWPPDRNNYCTSHRCCRYPPDDANALRLSGEEHVCSREGVKTCEKRLRDMLTLRHSMIIVCTAAVLTRIAVQLYMTSLTVK